MTSKMQFEALVVSPNLHILRGVLETLEDLPIEVDICMSPSRAADVLAKRNFDLVVIECDEGGGAMGLTETLEDTRDRRKTTIVALVDGLLAGKQVAEAGADVVIEKPLTSNLKSDFCKLVYSRMTREWRQEPRYAVRWLIAAQDTKHQPVQVTMEDISRTGIGLSFVGDLPVNGILTFRLLLPGSDQIIRFDARVLWKSGDNRAGAEFVDISTADADVLADWLQSRHCVKKPATEPAIFLSHHGDCIRDLQAISG